MLVRIIFGSYIFLRYKRPAADRLLCCGDVSRFTATAPTLSTFRLVVKQYQVPGITSYAAIIIVYTSRISTTCARAQDIMMKVESKMCDPKSFRKQRDVYLNLSAQRSCVKKKRLVVTPPPTKKPCLIPLPGVQPPAL